MDKRTAFLVVGIADILLPYILFTDQQYFSITAMLGILAIAACGIIILLGAYGYAAQHDHKNNSSLRLLFIILTLVSAVLIGCESFYAIMSGPSRYIWTDALTAIVALLVFTFGILAIGWIRSKMDMGKYKSYALMIVFIAIISILIFSVQAYRINVTRWLGSDELLFNYYASYLFIYGTNPYTASMIPILKAHGINPTLILNGTCECSYDYPAMSFLIPAAAGLAGGNFIISVVFVTIALIVIISFLIYKKLGTAHSLLPIAVWFVFFFYTAQAPIDQLFAVSLFLLVAYLYRTKPLLSGLFSGLAASTHQLSWFAIPFLFILILKESGKKPMLKSIVAAIIVFLAVNGYFIIASPSAVSNIFALFFTKLQFTGPSLMEFLVSFYPTAYWYSAFAIALTFISGLVLFYLYTDKLRHLIAMIPIIIFFLSWRNLFSYSFVFIPLLIVIYYSQKGEINHDLLKNNALAKYAPVFLFVFAAVVIIYAHVLYMKSADTLQINSVMPNIARNATGSSIISMSVNVSNNANSSETIFFYVVSRNPSTIKWFYGGETETIPPHGYYNYTLPYTLQQTNDTQIRLFLMNEGRISSVEVKP
jgi:uncharacterized membrane protein